MRVPLSWLREHAPVDVAADDIAAALVRAGLEVEHVERVGADIDGVVVGEILDVTLLEGFAKPVWHVSVDVGSANGPDGPRGIVCGASNYLVGDRVPVALPGSKLPGGVVIGARRTYGRLSDGMLASARELGLGDDHSGILVLDRAAPVGADVAADLHLRDDVLDVAVSPDRGYCLSVRGLAREVATAFDVPFDDPGLAEPTGTVAGHAVTVENGRDCLRYLVRTIRGVDPSARTPLEIRRRLSLAGMRPVSLPVDVTNYVLLWLGQPLHAFDLALLSGPVGVRRARAGERLRTLDGVDRALVPDDLVIADDSGPVALAGVMGGASTEVTSRTTDLLIESACFSPVLVARASRRHRLSSEAAKRFERGVDPDLAPVAAAAVADLMRRYGGAPGRAPVDPVTDTDARPERPVIRLSPGLPGRVAGRPYAPEVVRRRLVDVGCLVADTAGADDPLSVTPPPWRPDLTAAINLVEEVLRLEGYETIPGTLPQAPAGRGLSAAQRGVRAVGRSLAGAGYVEVTSYPFLAEDVFDRLGLPGSDHRRAAARVANPVSEQEPLLRTTLLPGLFAAVVRNVSRGASDLSLAETGLVFLARDESAPPALRPALDRRPSPDELAALDATLPRQPLHTAVVLTGNRLSDGWWGPGRPAVWADALEALRLIAGVVRVPVTVERSDAAPWHPGRCAGVRLGDRLVGHAGELHPRVVAAFALPSRTCVAEIDLSSLLAAPSAPAPAPALATYPLANQDVALVVGEQVPAAEVAEALRSGAGALLESVRLFDVYVGEQVGPGRRSLAYTLRFRAVDRTLTADEVTGARDAAVAEAARRTGAVLRGPS